MQWQRKVLKRWGHNFSPHNISTEIISSREGDDSYEREGVGRAVAGKEGGMGMCREGTFSRFQSNHANTLAKIDNKTYFCSLQNF